jgi:hypothetical protein
MDERPPAQAGIDPACFAESPVRYPNPFASAQPATWEPPPQRQLGRLPLTIPHLGSFEATNPFDCQQSLPPYRPERLVLARDFARRLSRAGYHVAVVEHRPDGSSLILEPDEPEEPPP